jgi:small subunit ribosomal protein S4
MHGARRRGKLSDYGVQLREKQRLRRYYGLQENQFHLFFERAANQQGVKGELFLQMLEMRLDNLVYRLGLAPSRRAARQFVRHNHVTLDGRKANVPSMIAKEGSVIEVKDNPKSRAAASQSLEAAESRELAPWLALDKQAFKGTVIRVPSRDEISPIVNEQLIVELYSK